MRYAILLADVPEGYPVLPEEYHMFAATDWLENAYAIRGNLEPDGAWSIVDTTRWRRTPWWRWDPVRLKPAKDRAPYV